MCVCVSLTNKASVGGIEVDCIASVVLSGLEPPLADQLVGDAGGGVGDVSELRQGGVEKCLVGKVYGFCLGFQAGDPYKLSVVRFSSVPALYNRAVRCLYLWVLSAN